jgi:cytochrome c oxidase subunit 2
MRRTPVVVVALAAALLLPACGDDDEPHAGPSVDGGEHGGRHRGPSDVAPGAREIEVVASSFEFDPDELTVRAGEDVAIVLTSADILHDLTLDELDAHVSADAGETDAGGFRADDPGTYAFYCSVEGHRAAGMEGTLTVEEG